MDLRTLLTTAAPRLLKPPRFGTSTSRCCGTEKPGLLHGIGAPFGCCRAPEPAWRLTGFERWLPPGAPAAWATAGGTGSPPSCPETRTSNASTCDPESRTPAKPSVALLRSHCASCLNRVARCAPGLDSFRRSARSLASKARSVGPSLEPFASGPGALGASGASASPAPLAIKSSNEAPSESAAGAADEDDDELLASLSASLSASPALSSSSKSSLSPSLLHEPSGSSSFSSPATGWLAGSTPLPSSSSSN
mmetsp:Transcript_65855/g.175389  ORF Transcript_65855/g.175389 Transcript_65855/m.175389 type:complete len:251 (+) Transcript_65855:320-1072(+)